LNPAPTYFSGKAFLNRSLRSVERRWDNPKDSSFWMDDHFPPYLPKPIKRFSSSCFVNGVRSFRLALAKEAASGARGRSRALSRVEVALG